MEPIVQLKTLDDLKKVLYLQKTITAQAKNELLSVVNEKVLDPEAIGDDAVKQIREFMEEERKVLTKYAKYPTLTEYQLMPSSYDGYKWGATFGVTLLIGELIFEQLNKAYPHFTHVSRHLFLILLSELDSPQHEYLIEPLEKALRIKVTSEGQEITPEQRKEYIRGMVNQFVETTVALCEGYGLMKVKKGGVVITPVGKRVLLHLADAARFVEDMTKAHNKFQISKPKLSMG